MGDYFGIFKINDKRLTFTSGVFLKEDQGCLREIGIFKIQTACQTDATSQEKGERDMKTTVRSHRKKKGGKRKRQRENF